MALGLTVGDLTVATPVMGFPTALGVAIGEDRATTVVVATAAVDGVTGRGDLCASLTPAVDAAATMAEAVG